MALESGSRLGPYEVKTLIGRGGMGEVYRARDLKLNRDVAIKVLPDHLAQDHERLARLHREAQLLATLNHPHIDRFTDWRTPPAYQRLCLNWSRVQRWRIGLRPARYRFAKRW